MKTHHYTIKQIAILTMLRIAVGWHFMYEGLFKYFDYGWTSTSFLQSSTGPFSEIFKELTLSHSTMIIVDKLNIYGLILIGLCLILGLFERPASLFGIILLLLYYLTYPPFYDTGMFVEGNYWIIDRNIIEVLVLSTLLVFPTSKYTGLDRIPVKLLKDKTNFFTKLFFAKS